MWQTSGKTQDLLLQTNRVSDYGYIEKQLFDSVHAPLLSLRIRVAISDSSRCDSPRSVGDVDIGMTDGPFVGDKKASGGSIATERCGRRREESRSLEPGVEALESYFEACLCFHSTKAAT